MRSTNRHTPTVERLENILSLSAVHHQPNAMRHKPAPAHVRPHADRSPHEKQISHTGLLIAGSAKGQCVYDAETHCLIEAKGRLNIGGIHVDVAIHININKTTSRGLLMIDDGGDTWLFAHIAYSEKLANASYILSSAGHGAFVGAQGTGYVRIIPSDNGAYTLGFNPHE